ncbi:MAG TPA: DMT family transporter [Methylophilus sp.]|mgnify:CR=1 FL=1|nr:DMT family transporter [Methylophilus sp.]HQQ34232.1 DMT family transporter [Methylophilus sp.]
MAEAHNKNSFAVFGLLYGALCWGLIWYPYRLMDQAGISGIASSFYTYCIALLMGAAMFCRRWDRVHLLPKSVVWLSLVAGWTNLSYVLAVINGEVMRVMLLFYLSPLWTLLLAHFWLKEQIHRTGFLTIAISLLGAFVMLHDFNQHGWQWPLPQNAAEWLALSSGMGFSLTNVITRKSAHLTIAAKSMLVWVGVAGMALLMLPVAESFPSPSYFTLTNWGVMTLIALLLLTATLFVQFGVTQMTAVRASVLFLFELVVAAVASYYLAHEVMTWNEWVGGAMIVAAALMAAVLPH